jgi:hypothetical protein
MKTNKVIQKHIEENYKRIEAHHVGKTVSTFQHVVRNAREDEYIPVCKFNRIYHKSTRFAYNIPDGLDCVYESKWEYVE